MVATSADVKQLVVDGTGVEYAGGDIRDAPNTGWVRVLGTRADAEDIVKDLDDWGCTETAPLSAAEHVGNDEHFYLVPST